ncbi:hypothetical protein BDQ17DRAFT_1452672 [Cyathus striatus]|nr:hypothetical protein BDQ17DRAFT_1452672 [Cyathus striatus]
MPQYNIVVSSLEGWTSKQQCLEMAATNTAPTVLPGDKFVHKKNKSLLEAMNKHTWSPLNSPMSNISSFTNSESDNGISNIGSFDSNIEMEQLQQAISNSLVTYQSEHNYSSPHIVGASSSKLNSIPVNVIIVETEETAKEFSLPSISINSQEKLGHKDKGKGIDSKEHGPEFDKLFNRCKKLKSKHARKAKVEFGPDNFIWECSELPGGGYFRATMEEPESEIESVPSDDNEGYGGNDRNNSDSNKSSSSSSSSSSNTSSNSNHSGNNHNPKKHCHQHKEYKKLKKALNRVKIKTLFTYSGRVDLDTFDQWTYEVDTWSDWNGLSDCLL